MKKLTALLLALMMTLSAAFAVAECPCAGGENLNTGEGDSSTHKLFLSNNYTIPYPFQFGRGTIDVCLHGYELSLTKGQTCCFINEGDTVYMHDCRGYGEMHNEAATFTFSLFTLRGGKLVLDGGFYTANGYDNGASAINIESGEVIVRDAVLRGNPVILNGDITVAEDSVLVTRTDTLIIVARYPEITYPADTVNVTAEEGADVTLRVDVKDWRRLTYQWFCNGTKIPGADKAEYTFTAAAENAGSEYYCVVTNDAPLSAQSSKYVLEVTNDGCVAPSVPATGDGASLTLWAGLLLLSGAAFILLRRKATR